MSFHLPINSVASSNLRLSSKPLLIDDLGMALRNEELKIHDRFTYAELRTYVRNERGTMSGSPHDDRVMALAMANQMRQYAFMPEFTLKQDEYWTVNWFRNLLPSGDIDCWSRRGALRRFCRLDRVSPDIGRLSSIILS